MWEKKDYQELLTGWWQPGKCHSPHPPWQSHFFLKNEIWKYRLPCRDEALLSAMPEAVGRAHSSCSTADYCQYIRRISCLALSKRQHPPQWTVPPSCLNYTAPSKPQRSCGLPGFFPPFIFLPLSSVTVWNKQDDARKDLSHPHSHERRLLHL